MSPPLSLSSIKMLSDELLAVAPFLQPYLSATEKAIYHVLNNSHLIQDSSSSQIVFKEAVMIFLYSANITSGDMFSMMWGNFSGLNEASIAAMIRNAVKMMIDMKIFGNAPMVYQALERFLASNDTNVIAQRMNEMLAWLSTTQASGLDLLSQALPRIYDILRPLLTVLSQMSMDMPVPIELFQDLAGNIIAMLRQVVSTGGFLAPMKHHQSMFQQGMTGGNHIMRSRHRRDTFQMPARVPMDDFIDLFYIDYPTMFQAIAVPPTTEEILETVYVFLSNPDLAVVLKGATSGMPWGLNASREETINAALGVLSFLTFPGTFHA